MKRRLVFATPFVVIACGKGRAVEHPREDEDEEEPEEAVVAPKPAPEPESEPVYPNTPRELVDKLPPLRGDKTIEDHCERVRCNPPVPYVKPKPKPVVPLIERVSGMQRDAKGTRVRVDRGQHMDTSWRAAFVTNADNPTELPGGECKIVAWDWDEIECITALSPEDLAINGHARPLRLVPPQALVDRIQFEIDTWRDPVTGPMRVRVVGVKVDADGVLLTVLIGTDLRLRKDWSITAKGVPCQIIRIDERTTICRAKLTPDQVHDDPFVTLTPPKF